MLLDKFVFLLKMLVIIDVISILILIYLQQNKNNK